MDRWADNRGQKSLPDQTNTKVRIFFLFPNISAKASTHDIDCQGTEVRVKDEYISFQIRGGQPCEMAAQVRELAAGRNDFSSAPWVHLLEREN